MGNTQYVSKQPDQNGFINYTDEENAVWQMLYERQIELVKNRACPEYIQGISDLQMTSDRIPQLPDINDRLQSLTGWQVESVPALIDFEKFFTLLANRKFPAATFIRTREECDYLQEPDIFHEIFGHCPMLTNQYYADFMEEYGKMGLHAEHKERVMLARLYWFTVEFGLIQTPEGLRIYGGGILSSPGETIYALESDKPLRKSLDPVDAFRTPYRIDIFQSVYFIIESFEKLYQLIQEDLIGLSHQARSMGMHTPLFPPKAHDINQEGDEYKTC